MRKIALAALATIAIIGCTKSNSDNIKDGDLHALKINSAIETRAEGNKWDAGDNIGVFMFEDNTTVSVGMPNTPYTTESESTSAIFTPASGYAALYYPQVGVVDIFAYYPYIADMAGLNYSVDVRSQEDMPSIDLLSASATDLAKNKSVINMTFYHRLSKIRIELQAGDGIEDSDLLDAQLSIEGLICRANYDLLSDQIDFGTYSATDILLNDDKRSQQNLTVEGIVIPQSADIKIHVQTVVYGEFSVIIKSQTFTAGQEYIYTLSVSRTKVELEGGAATIVDWSAGESLDLNADDLGGN